MDRFDSDCPPSIFREVVDYAKKHSMAMISGSDADTHITLTGTVGLLTKLVRRNTMPSLTL